MDLTADFASAQQGISAALISTTRSASQISAEDVAFHRSSSAKVARLLDSQNARLLALAEQLLRSAAPTFRANLTDFEAIDNHWNSVVDTVDSLLERSDTCLDEYNGRFRNPPVHLQKQGDATKKGIAFRNQNLPKPQLSFEHPPSNHETTCFRPLITSKPHAIVPFEKSLDLRAHANGDEQHLHPYQTEIDSYGFPPSVYVESEPILYSSFEDTQATFVDDYEGVLAMLDELREATEIAIDLEHHDTHSYVGIVSLMQISTRNHDWIVDTLKPWRRKLEVLNQVFADPKIVKVLHGAQMDAIWLQRDLGLYLVGLFDTHHASRVLGYAGGSLAFLLKKFVNFEAQKQYQMADWRIRPLPKELFDYARSDTHYLLYIYDNMRNELVQNSKFDVAEEDLVQEVLLRSKGTALQRYEHFIYDEDRGTGRGGWFALIEKNMSSMSKEQFAVYRKVHQWRDAVARHEDENVNSIMPNHVLFRIARSLPRDTPTLLSLSHPISQALRLRVDELLAVVSETVAGAQDEPELHEKINQVIQSDPSLARKSTVAQIQHSATRVQNTIIDNGSAITAAGSNIRSNSSSFWGQTLETSLRHREDIPTESYTNHLPLPFPRHQPIGFAAATGETRHGLRTPPTSMVDANSSHEGSATNLSSRSTGKRKAADVTSDSGPSDSVVARPVPTQHATIEQFPTISGDTSSAEAAATAERRAAKQARKAAKLAARGTGSADRAASDVDSLVQTPFDYSSAPSVLHAVRTANGPKPGKKAFNPYAKGDGAALGVKKAQEGRSGKSLTFKQ